MAAQAPEILVVVAVGGTADRQALARLDKVAPADLAILVVGVAVVKAASALLQVHHLVVTLAVRAVLGKFGL